MIVPAVAAGQHGCFSFAQALAAGWSRAQVATALRRGWIVQLRRGVYVSSDRFAVLSDRERHLARIQAEQLALGRHWHAAGRSAATVFELPLRGSVPDVPQLVADRGSRSTQGRNRDRRVTWLPSHDRGFVAGLAVTSPARTAVDLARREQFRAGVIAADAVIRGGVPADHLARCLDEAAARPGVERARRVVAFADGRSESALESLSRVAFAELGVPVPELQTEVWLGSSLVARVDFLWRAANTVGEADGLAKYGDSDAARKAAFWAAKRRQDALEDLGFEVVRWGWEEAWAPRHVLDTRVRRALGRGSRQVLAEGVRLVTTTLEVLRAA